ncbi:MAG: UDP-N-acetylmuramoyl-L-alanyl-D-glutamate--2,6-diaminopimelate ligase [Armatimonadetes bacterium]|nr:UDP-N-acetylmuramoyl-L-alanyl-D-glutamate--2,6-diaminopimelate ligase [Armatimonadota bacterium]
MRLSELVETAGVRFSADYASDPLVTGLSADTRRIQPGDLFVCMPSSSRDTHALIPEAAEKGAVAVVVHKPEGVAAARDHGLAVIGIADEGQSFNFALGRICQTFYGDPSADMRVVGVTGTNGKTTTAWMVRNALVEMGVSAAYLGTLGFQTIGAIKTLENTTPFPVELWGLLEQARADGCEVVVMEASSHALYQRRLAGVSFDVGVFTNFTQDHLDFHGTMEAYEEAKRLLFTEYAAASAGAFAACVNVGDPVGQSWIADLAVPVISFGAQGAMIETEGVDVKVDRLTLRCGEHEGILQFGGGYNVANGSAALAALVGLGYEVEESLVALAGVPPVPGRFEAIANDRGIGVLVDYAHTPDALVNVLNSVRALDPHRVITVFGCGGDRDRRKRPLMAQAASSLSDITIVTSDNPRTEDPNAIIDEIVPGLVEGAVWEREPDRRKAIELAVDTAQAGDVVVIAGKGHEDYQIIGREKVHMSDQEMARDALAGLSKVEV